MDTTVIAAIIGATGSILAALITFPLQYRAARKTDNLSTSVPHPNQSSVSSIDSNIEQRLRQDSRIQRLLNHKTCHDAAEAAIAYHCRGAACSVSNWQKSSTWKQVANVYADLNK